MVKDLRFSNGTTVLSVSVHSDGAVVSVFAVGDELGRAFGAMSRNEAIDVFEAAARFIRDNLADTKR